LFSKIFIIKKAVSDKSGKILKFTIQESSSHFNRTKNQTLNTCLVKTVSIDDFVKKNNIAVDFIKMDIEGSEIAALKGAKETIKKYKPKLAICIYHKLTDFYYIPKFIQSLNKHYKFYLEHHSKYLIETVLYCI
jgi:trehalose-6-phosphate synthase